MQSTIVAPGSDVPSAVSDKAPEYGENFVDDDKKDYSVQDGTSHAAPLVAGTLALYPRDDVRDAGRRSRGWVPSDPGRRHGDARSEAPGTLQTAGRLVQTGTSPRRPAARRSRTRGNWRPSSDAPRPATSGPARAACD